MKKRHAICGSVAFVLLLNACTLVLGGHAFAADDKETLTEASALLQANKVREAESLLAAASTSNPDSVPLHEALGKVYFREEKYEEAVRELGLAAQAEPDSREDNMLLSEALMGWKHFQVAVDFLHAVQPRFVQYPEFHYDLGFAYYNLNKMNEALAEFKEAFRLNPRLDRAEFLIASTIAAQGDIPKSVDIFRRLAKEHPKNEVYWVTLGEMLGDLGKKEDNAEALQACHRALALKPGDPRVEYVTATILLKDNDFAAAKPLFERLEKLDTKALEVHVALARIYARLGQRDLARKEAVMVADLQKQRTQMQAEWQKRRIEFQKSTARDQLRDGSQP